MTTALVWLRRDLRLHDHAALAMALLKHERVIPVFIFDRTILDPLPRTDARVAFILESLAKLKATLQRHGNDLLVRIGDPTEQIPALARQCAATAVYASRDYEPAVRIRDTAVSAALNEINVDWYDCKDQVIFECDEILTQAGKPFSVFTPYWRVWRSRLDVLATAEYPLKLEHLAALPAEPLPTLADLGFESIKTCPAGETVATALLTDFAARIDQYQALRDFPAQAGTSKLSAHLRFGTLSIRACVRLALAHNSAGAECWLKELCWREFYQQLLWHRPDLVDHAFHSEFDNLPFPNRQDWFTAWSEGRTGYPLIDAGMRQLNQTGYMHNRLRMICASFLVKDLLIDWRWGERYFAEKLLDYDLASNNSGWQWAASVGCDAQPWFRIFNPVTQSQKFDPEGKFIRRYCPELTPLSDARIHAPWLSNTILDYPQPLVDHASQRLAALALFNAHKAGTK